MLKVDLLKAFDSVNREWIFLIMKSMGFPGCWITWIRECLDTASFQVLINGEPHRPFRASNGVRQGDPLAPYLFLFAMQGFSVIINSYVDKKLISPIKASNSFSVSHVCFADDLMLFSEADVSNAQAVKDLLKEFSLVSGLHASLGKSQIILSKRDDRKAILQILNVPIAQLPLTYLGVPIFMGKLRKKNCGPLLDRVKKILDSWKTKVLSLAGRVELVISTLSAIHLYWSSTFFIPMTIMNEIDRISRSFIWGDTNNSNKIHWVAWKDICRPKK